jgi:hypothetical protein
MTPLPRGFAPAAAWLAICFLFAAWPLARAFSAYTGVMIEAPPYVRLTALGVLAAFALVFLQLLRLRPGGIWLSIALAAIFAASSILKLPALAETGQGEPAVWFHGVIGMLSALTAVYLSRPAVLGALERRRTERAGAGRPETAAPGAGPGAESSPP